VGRPPNGPHARSLRYLAGDFLTVGRIDARGVNVRSEPIVVERMLSEVISDSRERSRLALMSGAPDLRTQGDEDRIRHALASVIARVLEASPHEVNVHLRDSTAWL